MIGNIGCLTYVKNKKEFCSSLRKDKAFEVYRNKYTDLEDVIDGKDWIVGFGRRWSSLKLYYNIRAFGIKGYQEHIRFNIYYIYIK